MGKKVKPVYTGDEAAVMQQQSADFARELLSRWSDRLGLTALQNQQARQLEQKQLTDLAASQNAKASELQRKQKQEADALAASRASASQQAGGLAPVAAKWPTKAPMTSPTARPKPLRARLFQSP